MVKLRDLIVNAMTDEEKAKVKPRSAEAMSDDEIAALPDNLDWLKKAAKKE